MRKPRQIAVHVDGPGDMSPGEAIAALAEAMIRICVHCGADPGDMFEAAASDARREAQHDTHPAPAPDPSPGEPGVRVPSPFPSHGGVS